MEYGFRNPFDDGKGGFQVQLFLTKDCVPEGHPYATDLQPAPGFYYRREGEIESFFSDMKYVAA